MANVIEFTSVANRLGYLAEEPVYTPTGLGLSILREGGKHVLRIERDAAVRTEEYDTRAQAWARAAVMMGRVES